MAISLITGHKATNHISAADDAAYSAAFVNSGNCVIADAQNITITVDPDAGSVSVGSFSALFSGRKIVSTGETQTYTTPASGKYKRVSVGLTYTRDTSDDDVESCALSCYISADNSTSSGAASDSTNAPSASDITAATTTAYMELFDLVVSDTAVISSTVKYSLSRTVSGLGDFAESARMEYDIYNLDRVTSTGLYFKQTSCGSVSDFLQGKRLAFFVFSSTTDDTARAVCAYAVGSGGRQPCFPSLLTISGATKSILFGVTFVSADDELVLGSTGVGDTWYPSTIPFDYCRVYAWR